MQSASIENTESHSSRTGPHVRPGVRAMETAEINSQEMRPVIPQETASTADSGNVRIEVASKKDI